MLVTLSLGNDGGGVGSIGNDQPRQQTPLAQEAQEAQSRNEQWRACEHVG